MDSVHFGGDLRPKMSLKIINYEKKFFQRIFLTFSSWSIGLHTRIVCAFLYIIKLDRTKNDKYFDAFSYIGSPEKNDVVQVVHA